MNHAVNNKSYRGIGLKVLAVALIAIFGGLLASSNDAEAAGKTYCSGNTFESSRGLGPAKNELSVTWGWCGNGKRIQRVVNRGCDADPAIGWHVVSTRCKATRSGNGYLLNAYAKYKSPAVCVFGKCVGGSTTTITQQVYLSPSGRWEFR